MVDENAKGAAVGKPISAKDDDDVLLYDLVDPDTTTRKIPPSRSPFDPRTGQITTKVELDANPDGPDGDTDENDHYTVSGDGRRPVYRQQAR